MAYFWDAYEGAIHKNEKLSDVDKFAYLRGLLEEPARSTVAGFALTSSNYNDAIELLKRRFGKDEKIQRAHINELLNLKPVFKTREIMKLRRLYDTVEKHHRGLKAFGLDEATYSTFRSEVRNRTQRTHLQLLRKEKMRNVPFAWKRINTRSVRK